MTVELTWKRRQFLERMIQNAEQAQWGFELLLKRDNFAEFFDHLRTFELFSPANNPAPVPVEDGKYVRIPYWPALDYLEACAKLAGRNNDLALAGNVLDVVREVTRARQVNNGHPDNYHTHRKFAEILGHLPTVAISRNDLDLIPTLLDSRFDRGGVGRALDQGLMKRFLQSMVADDWSKACRVLWHCTKVVWVDEEGLEQARKKPISIVDDYWLKKFIEHHATALGSQARGEAAEVLLARLREVYREGDRAKASWLFRPAIEDHKQNHEWAGADNRFVEGLREALLAWLDVDAASAAPYVDVLLVDEAEIVRRVALHVLNQRWEVLRGLFGKLIRPELFGDGHLHELHGLLRDRFNSFAPEEKGATVEALRQIQPLDSRKDPERSLKRVQRNWLSAIVGQGFEAADTWYAALHADASLGRLSEYPDFHTYMESWSGPGPTPLRPEQLIEFAKEGSLVQRLNAFEPENSWRGPTKRALVDALEEAVTIAPDILLAAVPEFIEAQRPYQYGIINGFKRLWDAPKDKAPDIAWDQVWSVLIKFFENLIGNDSFWTEPVVEERDLTPTRNWIPPLISEFLRSGTRSDDKVYGEELLPRSWQLIRALLDKSEAESEADKDAMTQAINSAKGKAIEALFSHALRICRLGNRVRNGVHADEWAIIHPVFDAEIAKCQNANFEFSTLAGAYLANIEYINSEWLRANVDGIFSTGFPQNFFCAVAGLAYAPATRPIYHLLAGRGVLDRALRSELGERNTQERLIERIALAYLWGDEELSSPRFVYFFDEKDASDLQIICNFLWSVSNQNLVPDQVQRILAFWQKCIEWSKKLEMAPARLLSSLSRLSVYLTKVDADETVWLEYVAPYVQTEHNADEFIEQLLRLVEVNPRAISATLAKVLETYEPTFDYDDTLKGLIRKLAGKGLAKEAIDFASHLRRLPGMQELYYELVQ